MLLPTSPAQRVEIYDDVQDLLIPGFIAHHAEINGVAISIRSPTRNDFLLLQHRAVDSIDSVWKAWFVAGLTWMVGGQIILGDQRATRMIYDTVLGLPASALDILFSIAIGLLNRVHESHKKVEAFCYEDMSRTLWNQCRDDLEKQSGIPGIESIGRTLVQQIWISVNRMEDDRIQMFRSWESAKLIASVHAYKAIRRMSQHEQLHRDQEDQRRQEVLDRTYYIAKGFHVDDEAIARDKMTFPSKSADELSDEYRRWVQGELDLHDHVVADHKERIRSSMMRERHLVEERRRQFQESVDQLQLPESTPQLVGYTSEQMDQILQKRPHQGIRRIEEQDLKHRLFDQFLAGKEVPGQLDARGVFQKEEEEEKKPSLNDLIENRQVRIR